MSDYEEAIKALDKIRGITQKILEENVISACWCMTPFLYDHNNKLPPDDAIEIDGHKYIKCDGCGRLWNFEWRGQKRD